MATVSGMSPKSPFGEKDNWESPCPRAGAGAEAVAADTDFEIVVDREGCAEDPWKQIHGAVASSTATDELKFFDLAVGNSPPNPMT
ncbi:MAG: hypothetical protein R3A47_01745 [Polyangiales bacterium]